MKIVEPSVAYIDKPTYNDLVWKIETAARLCYKSEGLMKQGSGERLIKSLIERGHEAAIEHGSITVKIVCDRGVSHEIVRHRLASYCQESTRYCNYSKEQFGGDVTFVRPSWQKEPYMQAEKMWVNAMRNAENAYFSLLSFGLTAQEARVVLPNSLKTEIAMTANIREWRHFLKLRTSKKAHPDMRRITTMILKMFRVDFPVFFEDIEDW